MSAFILTGNIFGLVSMLIFCVLHIRTVCILLFEKTCYILFQLKKININKEILGTLEGLQLLASVKYVGLCVARPQHASSSPLLCPFLSILHAFLQSPSLFSLHPFVL